MSIFLDALIEGLGCQWCPRSFSWLELSVLHLCNGVFIFKELRILWAFLPFYVKTLFFFVRRSFFPGSLSCCVLATLHGALMGCVYDFGFCFHWYCWWQCQSSTFLPSSLLAMQLISLLQSTSTVPLLDPFSLQSLSPMLSTHVSSLRIYLTFKS